MPDLAHTKNQLRERALKLRNEIANEDGFLVESSFALGTSLLSIPEISSMLTQPLLKSTGLHALESRCSHSTIRDVSTALFASYAPHRGEPDPNGFLALIDKYGGVRPRMAFPRIAGKGKLTMHFACLEELKPGTFSISEPGDDFELAKLDDIDVMLVPGLAFDPKGSRLGYGKGYYDQLLSSSSPKSKRPLLVGISFDETLFDEIPAEDHDIKMDYLITPTRVIKTNSAP